MPSSTFDCGITSINYKGRDLKLPKEDHPFGQLTVAEIVSHSSNRGAAQLAMLMGEDRFHEYARKYGFGQTTKFQLGGEVRGVLERPARLCLLPLPEPDRRRGDHDPSLPAPAIWHKHSKDTLRRLALSVRISRWRTPAGGGCSSSSASACSSSSSATRA